MTDVFSGVDKPTGPSEAEAKGQHGKIGAYSGALGRSFR